MLVNGAGVNSASPYLDAKDEDWDRVIDSNLKAVHWGCQVFGRHMAEAGGGSILNVASVSAHLPLSRVFAYSASKAAVVNLTQNVARELAPMGVRVNALSPGFFPAEQNRKILDPARVEKIMAGTPMARFGEPARAGRRHDPAALAGRRQLHHRRHLLRRRRLHGHAALIRTRRSRPDPIREPIPIRDPIRRDGQPGRGGPRRPVRLLARPGRAPAGRPSSSASTPSRSSRPAPDAVDPARLRMLLERPRPGPGRRRHRGGLGQAPAHA